MIRTIQSVPQMQLRTVYKPLHHQLRQALNQAFQHPWKQEPTQVTPNISFHRFRALKTKYAR